MDEKPENAPISSKKWAFAVRQLLRSCELTIRKWPWSVFRQEFLTLEAFLVSTGIVALAEIGD
ncbi:MAG: hypothetical protein NTV64_09615, partial [Polaromonas sp.]|nr:hypothetical protein [Polaromonas sp.]